MPLFPLDSSLGALFIGTVVSSIIYGMTCMQVYLYYTEYSGQDRPLFKAFVGLLMVIDTLQIALPAHGVYYYLVTSFGDYVALLHEPWSLLAQVVTEGFLIAAVQIFLAYRIYGLSKFNNIWLPTVTTLFAMAGCATACVFVAKEFITLHAMTDYTGKEIQWAWISLIMAVTTNIAITAGTLYYLYKYKTQSPFKRTNKAMGILISYCLHTGLLVTAFAATALALTIIRRHKNPSIYAVFLWVLGRLYSCTFMSTLNSRRLARTTLQTVSEFATLSVSQTKDIELRRISDSEACSMEVMESIGIAI